MPRAPDYLRLDHSGPKSVPSVIYHRTAGSCVGAPTSGSGSCNAHQWSRGGAAFLVIVLVTRKALDVTRDDCNEVGGCSWFVTADETWQGSILVTTSG